MYRIIELESFNKFDDLISDATKVFICKIANEYNTICWHWNNPVLRVDVGLPPEEYTSVFVDGSSVHRYTLKNPYVCVSSDALDLYVFIAVCLKYFDYWEKYEDYRDNSALKIIADGTFRKGCPSEEYYTKCIKEISSCIKIDLMSDDTSTIYDSELEYVRLYRDYLYNNILGEAISNIVLRECKEFFNNL